MSMSRSRISASWLIASLIALAGFSGQVSADPPMRVARVSFISGDVSMQPAGLNEWSQAMINRPMSTGDALYLDRAALAELDIGAATIRIDERTSLRILELDDQRAQIELTAGTINLSIRNVYEGQYYEIATPTVAFVVEQPGIYRVDISPSGDSTMISVVDGYGTVYGQGDASYSVNDGRSYRFNDTSLADYQIFSLPVRDEFDEWCLERAQRYDDSQSRRYVSEDVIGYSDLDEYGSWSSAPSYGSIWYPRGVSVGWAPYRNGRWAWIDPWGWTWVDNSPWGFAPFHYGRWAYVGSRWGWVPGPRVGRPIYAPALVAFVGGGGFSVGISSGPIGWFPLGPRDVYVPWYQGSRNYFNNINVRNTTVINNTYITNVYNDYSNGRPINNANYAYRDNDRAVTAVARDTFVNARSVDLARVRVSRAELQRAEVVSRVQIAPTQRSFTGGSAVRGNGGAQARKADFERTVIARTAPPASKPNAQERIRAISRNENQPLAVNQMRDLSARTPRNDVKGGDRVQVVGDGRVDTATAKPLPTKSPAQDTGRQERVATDRSAAGSDPARKPVNAQPQDKTAGSNPSARQPRPVASDTRDREVSRDQTKPNQPDQPAPRSTKPAGTTVQGGVVTSPRSRVEKDSTRADAQRTQREPAARTQPAVDQRKQPSQPAAEPIRSPEQAKPAATSRTVQRAPQQQQDNRVQQPQPRTQPAPQRREVQQKTPSSPANQQRQEQPRATTRPPQVPQQQPAPQQEKQQAQQRQVQPQPQQQQRQQQQQQQQPQQQRQQPQPQQQRQAQPQAAPVQANPQRQQRKAKETDEENEEKSERKQRGG